jgi:hypothetical protein
MGVQKWTWLRSRRSRKSYKSLRSQKLVGNESFKNKVSNNEHNLLVNKLIHECVSESVTNFDEECATTFTSNNNESSSNHLVYAHKNLLQSNAVINDIKNVLWDQLEVFHLSIYLNGPMMDMTHEEYVTFKYRIKDLLYFIYHKQGQNKMDTECCLHVDSSKLMRNFILREFMILPEYCSYLKDVCGHRPFTIRNYLEHISKFLEWFVSYRVGSCKRLHSRHLDAMKKLIKRLRHKNNKDIKISMGDNTIEALIEKGRWPKGGLKELQTAIENEISWVNKLTQPITTTKAYNRYMQLLCSAAYCFSPQGRCGAYEDLKYGQRFTLINDGYVLSTKFKTRSKFGYQPITSNRIFEKLLSFYISNIRPKQLLGDNDPMFINFGGTGAYKIRQSVPKFFMRTLNLHINTTTIRSIVETTMHKLQVVLYFFIHYIR